MAKMHKSGAPTAAPPSSPVLDARSKVFFVPLEFSNHVFPILGFTILSYFFWMALFWATIEDVPCTHLDEIGPRVYRMSSWSFFVVLLSNVRTIWQRRNDAGSRVDANCSMYCVVTINVMALTSHLCMSYEVMPVALSAWGRPAYTAQGALWVSVVPMLMILMHSLHDVEYAPPLEARSSLLSFTRWLLKDAKAEMWRSVCALTLSTYFGVFMMMYDLSRWHPATRSAMMFLSCVFFLHLFRTKRRLSERVAKLNKELGSKSDYVSVDDVVQDQVLERTKDCYWLCSYCLCSWAALVVVYCLGLYHCISVESEVLFYVSFDVSSKAVYSSIVGDIHFKFLSPQRLKSLLVRMEQLASDKRHKFLRYLMHEFRVPLNTVHLGIESVLSRGGAGEEQLTETKKKKRRKRRKESTAEVKEGEESTYDVLRMVRAAILAMSNVVEDTLHFASTEEGKISLDLGAMDLETTLRGAFELFENTAAQCGVELTVSVAPDLPAVVLGDARKLALAVSNFTANAINVTRTRRVVEKQKRRPRVSLKILRLDDNKHLRRSSSLTNIFLDSDSKEDPAADVATVRVEVADEGDGMTEQEQRHIFEAFQHLRPGNPEDGRGLSMAVTRNLIKLHGGEVGVRSNDVGSTFYFVTPLKIVDADALLPLNKLALKGRNNIAR